MRLIRYHQKSPWKILDNLPEEFSRWANLSDEQKTGELRFAPAIDVWEDKEHIFAEVDLPGFDEKDINVKLKGNNLIISANRDAVIEEQKKNYYRCERVQGSFYRALDLPVAVDPAKVKADYKKGVLKITLAKKEEEKEVKVEVH